MADHLPLRRRVQGGCKYLHNLTVPLQLVNLGMGRGLCVCLPALHTCNAMLQVPCKQQYPASAKD